MSYLNRINWNQKEVNKVYQTSNLDLFNVIKGNRPPNPQHIKRLADSMIKNGMMQSPIIVNENFDVIDGQHRLMAARAISSFIYYIIQPGYGLKEVQELNINQKNWSKKDFMEGFSTMGILPYQKLKSFCELNKDYTLPICLAFCNNTTDSTHNRQGENLEVFEDGTWKGRDFKLGQNWANQIRLIKPYYQNYNQSSFVGTMVSLFKNKDFDLNTFLHKLKLQPTALLNCRNRTQYKLLIEEIYNYKNRKKVNLRY